MNRLTITEQTVRSITMDVDDDPTFGRVERRDLPSFARGCIYRMELVLALGGTLNTHGPSLSHRAPAGTQ